MPKNKAKCMLDSTNVNVNIRRDTTAIATIFALDDFGSSTLSEEYLKKVIVATGKLVDSGIDMPSVSSAFTPEVLEKQSMLIIDTSSCLKKRRCFTITGNGMMLARALLSEGSNSEEESEMIRDIKDSVKRALEKTRNAEINELFQTIDAGPNYHRVEMLLMIRHLRRASLEELFGKGAAMPLELDELIGNGFVVFTQVRGVIRFELAQNAREFLKKFSADEKLVPIYFRMESRVNQKFSPTVR